MTSVALPESRVANKKPKSDRKTEKIEFMVTADQRAALEKEAESWNLTLSAWIMVACEEKRRKDNADKSDE